MSGTVESWSPARYMVDGTCMDCGETGTVGYEIAEGTAKLARIRRWAIKHAAENVGHTAMVEVIRPRCYKARSVPTGQEASDGTAE